VNIHELIYEILEKERYSVLNAYSGTEALMVLEKDKVDLILLDLMLPGLNGEEILKKVNNIPVIVISAKISLDDKVNCLFNGANDYITKPFDKQELLARIQVQLRINKSINSELVFKNLKLLNDKHTLLIDKEKVNLTKTEYAIMKQLLLNPTQVITKSKLLDLISLDTEDCDENSLKVHISNIRRKIRKIRDSDYIESVWGIGFKMHE
jgi:DNA-binding response OmpR family regulator